MMEMNSDTLLFMSHLPSESNDNLKFLRPGQTYHCFKALPGGPGGAPRLRENHRYRFESFSGDPLGDTRQFLFTELETEQLRAAELANEPTPEWRDFLKAETER